MDKNQSLQIQIPPGLNVLFSDTVIVTKTEYGVVLDFAQSIAGSKERRVVSRIGMSEEHVKALIKVMESKVNEKPPLQVKPGTKKIN